MNRVSEGENERAKVKRFAWMAIGFIFMLLYFVCRGGKHNSEFASQDISKTIKPVETSVLDTPKVQMQRERPLKGSPHYRRGWRTPLTKELQKIADQFHINFAESKVVRMTTWEIAELSKSGEYDDLIGVSDTVIEVKVLMDANAAGRYVDAQAYGREIDKKDRGHVSIGASIELKQNFKMECANLVKALQRQDGGNYLYRLLMDVDGTWEDYLVNRMPGPDFSECRELFSGPILDSRD